MSLLQSSRLGPFLAFALVCALLALGCWCLLAAGLADGFNRSAMLWLHATASPGLASFAVGITESGSMVAIPGYGVLLFTWWWITRRHPAALGLIATLAGALGSVVVFKLLVHETRPQLFPWLQPETGFSFPSGHTTMAWALGLYLAGWLLAQPTRSPGRVALAIGVLGWSSLVGLSRIYVGVHWPLDVIASVFLGSAWAVLGLALATEKARKQGRHAP